MQTNALRKTLDHLRQAMAPSELTDEQLLHRFIAGRDEAAFSGLVRRHGPMVLGVSRRVLGNLHDAEDVFQATFLVLAQKPRSVVNRQAIAGWLYTIAYRIALQVRGRNALRRGKEMQVPMSHPEPAAPEVQDWQPILDTELNGLPDKYRLPLILCDLEGRSRKEAERQLQIPPGTLSSRLANGRRLLAKRLARRGVVLSGGALATAITAASASAVPPVLVATTTKAAVLVAAGNWAGVSSSVLLLMKTGVKAMFMAKMKATVATVVILGVLGAGGLVYSGGGRSQGNPNPQAELQRVRKENELLQVNIRALLERIQTLEKQAADSKTRASVSFTADSVLDLTGRLPVTKALDPERPKDGLAPTTPDLAAFRTAEVVAEVLQRAAQRAAAEPRAEDAVRHATEVLEKALRELRVQNRKNRPPELAPPTPDGAKRP